MLHITEDHPNWPLCLPFDLSEPSSMVCIWMSNMTAVVITAHRVSPVMQSHGI